MTLILLIGIAVSVVCAIGFLVGMTGALIAAPTASILILIFVIRRALLQRNDLIFEQQNKAIDEWVKANLP